MPNTIRVHAVPGRLYPHPYAGHRQGVSGPARFVGRGLATHHDKTGDVDERWPILPKGEALDYSIDLEIAFSHGDLSRVSMLPTPEEPAAPPSAPTEAPHVTPETIIHTDANIAGGQAIQRVDSHE